MTKKEFGTFTMALKTYYSKENLLPNEQAMELWYRELCDIPYEVAEAALRKWVATNKWSPSIAEIREMTSTVIHGEQLTWGEAWERALKAVRKYGHLDPKKALESLDPLTRKCVQNIGYMQLCMSENIMVERAHFQKIFDIYAKRERADQNLPTPLLEQIDRLRLDGGTGMLRLGGGSRN